MEPDGQFTGSAKVLDSSPNITDRLTNVDATTGVGVDAIMPAVYDEIRRIAQAQMSRERADHTLSATALANEAYLKLVDQTRVDFRNRQHFMAIAAQAIRRILIDHARSRNRQKRGGNESPVRLNTSIMADSSEVVDLLALEEALQKLERLEPEKARVVELRFFGEMTEAQIADLLGITERTVRRYWQYARAWLYRELAETEQQLDEP